MDLPAELQAAINVALSTMEQDPEHSVRPILRLAIYRGLASASAASPNRARAILAVLTAQRVLHIWYQHNPGDYRPEKFLNLALGVLDGTVPTLVAYSEAIAAANAIREDAYGDSEDFVKKEDFPGRSYHALEAIIEAVIEVVGKTLFRDGNIREKSFDEVIDWWHEDTAFRAAEALSGNPGVNAFDPIPRHAFWELRASDPLKRHAF